jgi:hypothetical protein
VTFSHFGANIKVVGVPLAQLLTVKENFFKPPSKLPYVIEISSIGFISKQVNITTNNQKVNILLKDEQNLLNEIVVSASRTPERVLESQLQLKEWELQTLKSQRQLLL